MRDGSEVVIIRHDRLTIGKVGADRVGDIAECRTVSGFIIVILLSLLPDNPYLRRVEPAALNQLSTLHEGTRSAVFSTGPISGFRVANRGGTRGAQKRE